MHSARPSAHHFIQKLLATKDMHRPFGWSYAPGAPPQGPTVELCLRAWDHPRGIACPGSRVNFVFVSPPPPPSALPLKGPAANMLLPEGIRRKEPRTSVGSKTTLWQVKGRPPGHSRDGRSRKPLATCDFTGTAGSRACRSSSSGWCLHVDLGFRVQGLGFKV